MKGKNNYYLYGLKSSVVVSALNLKGKNNTLLLYSLSHFVLFFGLSFSCFSEVNIPMKVSRLSGKMSHWLMLGESAIQANEFFDSSLFHRFPFYGISVCRSTITQLRVVLPSAIAGRHLHHGCIDDSPVLWSAIDRCFVDPSTPLPKLFHRCRNRSSN